MNRVKLIKLLRSETNFSLTLCQQALIESNDNYEDAKKYLEKKGIDGAKKKEGRDANMSAFFFKSSGHLAIVFEIFLETDFVLNNEIFQKSFSQLIDFSFENEKLFDTVADFYNIKFQDNLVSEFISHLVTKMGEKIGIKNISKFRASDNQFVGGYVRNLKDASIKNIGLSMSVVLLKIDMESSINRNFIDEQIEKLIDNLGKQVIAFKPKYISVDKIPESDLQAMKDSFNISDFHKKPKEIVDKVVLGKLEKMYNECVLLEQKFFLDQDKTVAKLIEEYDSNLNIKIEVLLFERFS